MTDADDLQPIRGIEVYPVSRPLTSTGIETAVLWMTRLAGNVGDPDAAEAIRVAIEALKDRADSIAKHRIAARDELLRYIAAEHYHGMSAARVAAELTTTASRLTSRRPLQSPAVLIWRVVFELNSGRIPSDKTIRNALRK